jgi:competence protein ComEA
MPWRAIEAPSGDAAATAPATSGDRSAIGLSRSAIALLAVAAFVAVGAFALAFGSGASSAV